VEVAMSRQSVAEFLERVTGDTQLAQRLEACDTAEVLGIAKELGHEFAEEDLVQGLAELGVDQTAGGELSDDELERVAGGTLRKIPGRLKWSDITLKKGY
jgi:predicted ribosomally synthesized peptide with nif11-like leader